VPPSNARQKQLRCPSKLWPLDVGAADVDEAVSQLEIAMRAIASGVDDTLGNALVIEVKDLLSENARLRAASGRAHLASGCSDRRR
jgi:hypothetical protein